MAKRRHRAFAAFGAALFLLTSSALTIAIVLDAVSNKDSNNASNTSQQENKVDPAKQLKGKPLNGFTPVAQINQLQATDTKTGAGDTVKPGDTITVDYTGAVASTGIIFESSLDSGQPATLSLQQVIAGWSQGIPGMKVGGSRRLLIPASLGYGAQGAGSIPPNADLVFDVTVHSISK